MGLAQPGTPADSFDFPSCCLLDVVRVDGTIGCCFLLCVTICSLTQKPHLRGRVFCSQPGTPPWRTTDGSLKGTSLVSFSVGVVSAQADGVLWVSICSFTWKHHTGGDTLLSLVIALGNSSQFL